MTARFPARYRLKTVGGFQSPSTSLTSSERSLNLFGRPKADQAGIHTAAIRRRVRGGDPEATAEGLDLAASPGAAVPPTPAPTDASPPTGIPRGRIIAPDTDDEETATVTLDPVPVARPSLAPAAEPPAAEQLKATPPAAPSRPPGDPPHVLHAPTDAASPAETAADTARVASGPLAPTNQTPPEIVRPRVAAAAAVSAIHASRRFATGLARGLGALSQELATLRLKLPNWSAARRRRTVANVAPTADPQQGPARPDPGRRLAVNLGPRLAAFGRTLRARARPKLPVWSGRRATRLVGKVALAAGIAFVVATAASHLHSSGSLATVAQLMGLDETGPVGAFLREVQGSQPSDPRQPAGALTGDPLMNFLTRLGLREMEAEALPAVSRAYRAQFGHGLDEDLEEHQDEIEEWLIKWKAAYTLGEPWARGMAGP